MALIPAISGGGGSSNVIYEDIPYSDFTWNSSRSRWSTNNPDTIPTGYTLLGFIVNITNGGGIAGASLNSGYVVVFGLQSATTYTPLSSSFTFTCTAILKKT